MNNSYLKLANDKEWFESVNNPEVSRQMVQDFINTLVAYTKYIKNIAYTKEPSTNLELLNLTSLLQQYNNMDVFTQKEEIEKIDLEISQSLSKIVKEDPKFEEKVKYFASMSNFAQGALRQTIDFHKKGENDFEPNFCSVEFDFSKYDDDTKKQFETIFGTEFEKVLPRLQTIISKYNFVYRDKIEQLSEIIGKNKIPNSIVGMVQQKTRNQNISDIISNELIQEHEKLDEASTISLIEAMEVIKDVKPDILTEEQIQFLNNLKASLSNEIAIKK